MSLGSDLLGLVRRMFLLDQELIRLADEVKGLTSRVNHHDVRLAVVENTLALAVNRSRLILPGN